MESEARDCVWVGEEETPCLLCLCVLCCVHRVLVQSAPRAFDFRRFAARAERSAW
jgi:hypothetical protein